MTPRTDTPTLIAALRILARDIHCEDGVATACIAEAADRLEELNQAVVDHFRKILERFKEDAEECK